ncbi:MAG: transporter [Beijerinckiaceae bacterium]|nr:transporter [Beijerinckiaceae bacterium]
MKSGQKLRYRAIMVGALLCAGGAYAAEEGKSVYLLGVTASMAGMTPPPGFYASSFTYLYNGVGSGDAALSRTFGQAGVTLPSFGSLRINAGVKATANVGLDVLSLLWVAPEKVMGGHFGVGVLAPFGYQGVDVDIKARAALTFPNGTTLQRGGRARISDETFAMGDPLLTAFIGWSSGNFHWKLSGLVNIPIGSYAKPDLVNIGFNRWAADLTGALTWLDPSTGFEISVAPGLTFNGNNPTTNYKTGTEFHVEAAVMQHFSKSFAIGLAGYHYRQLTGDSGSGAVLGAFKGEVSAIGPNLTYNFQIGKVPVFTSVRWLHEFKAKNRLAGDAAFLTVTVPLGGGSRH